MSEARKPSPVGGEGGRWRELALLAVALLRKDPGIGYGDIRFTSTTGRSLLVKNGRPEKVAEGLDRGFGVRLLAGGAWGFAASSELSEESVARAVGEAREVARASARRQPRPVRLCEAEPAVADLRFPVAEDPLAMPLEEQLGLLVRATREMQRTPEVQVASGALAFSRHSRLFASTEGSLIGQEWTLSGGEISATAIAGSEVQIRSYPNSMGGDHGRGGFEFIRRLDLPAHALRVATEAAALLRADPCPAGRTDLVLDSSQMALQVHESCGHAAELDRVLGDEISLAGGSFLTPDRRGGFRFGSPAVTIVADATLPGGVGSFGYDDEGVPASRFDLVRQGRFTNWLASRETAASQGMARSNGTMRADGWQNIPLIRMTNINLEPGIGTLEELISEVRQGVYLETNRSWSIDDRRLNFHFGLELGREIRHGRLGRLLRNPVYAGITPEFWGSCDAVAGLGAWRLWGIPGCGKGEPLQVVPVGHGAAPARFRGVEVGVRR